MIKKLNQFIVIILLIYIINKCDCATRRRGPPAKKQSIKLTPDEIDPNVSPILLQQNNIVSTIIPTVTPTGGVTELINTLNEQQQEQQQLLAPTGNIDNIINGLDSTTLEPIELNVNNTVLDPVDELTSSTASSSSSSSSTSSSTPTNVDDPNPISKFCKCSDTSCNCCRDFSLPLVPVRGPGCAKINYLGNERMSVQIKYGDIVLAQRTINGKKAPPVCVGLPGGYTRFCARIYGLSKEKSGFKSCLSLELRAEDELEAQLRVSCFRFSDKGLSVTEAEPVPQIENEKDDEDDDDIFGLGGGGDDEDEDPADDYDDEDDDDDDDDDVETPTNDESDSDYDFRFISDVFGSGEKKTKTKSKISILSNNDEPQFKDATGDTIENNAINNNVAVQIKKKNNKTKTKNNKKIKNSDDEYESITDIFFAVLNNFF